MVYSRHFLMMFSFTLKQERSRTLFKHEKRRKPRRKIWVYCLSVQFDGEHCICIMPQTCRSSMIIIQITYDHFWAQILSSQSACGAHMGTVQCYLPCIHGLAIFLSFFRVKQNYRGYNDYHTVSLHEPYGKGDLAIVYYK